VKNCEHFPAGDTKNSIRIPSRISWGSFPRFTPLMPTSLMPTFRQSLMATSQTKVYKGFFIFKGEATVKMYRDLYNKHLCKGIKSKDCEWMPAFGAAGHTAFRQFQKE